jgi:hypothetical protein
MKTVGPLVLGLAALLASVGPAAADLIQTYQFTATVTSVTDNSPGQTFVPHSITPGTSTIVGTFSYDAISGTGGFYRGTGLMLGANATIDSTYGYSVTTPTSNDEIDIFGSPLGFEYFKRGPTVPTLFDPNIPVSHFEFTGLLSTSVDPSQAQLSLPTSGPPAQVGISDQQTDGSPYWFIGGNITTLEKVAPAVPEPGSLLLLASSAGVTCAFGWWRRRSR